MPGFTIQNATGRLVKIYLVSGLDIEYSEYAQSIEDAQEQEKNAFPSFTWQTAWDIGNELRNRIMPSQNTTPALITISLANSEPEHHTLFQCVIGSCTTPYFNTRAARKRATVLRFGRSTYSLPFQKNTPIDHARWMEMYTGDDPIRAASYSCHSGGFPIRVKGSDGVVGVITVVTDADGTNSHQVIAEVVEDYVRQQTTSA